MKSNTIAAATAAGAIEVSHGTTGLIFPSSAPATIHAPEMPVEGDAEGTKVEKRGCTGCHAGGTSNVGAAAGDGAEEQKSEGPVLGMKAWSVGAAVVGVVGLTV